METINDHACQVLSCRLTSAELRLRKEEALASLKNKVLERKELPDAFLFRFTGSDQLLQELFQFIQSERACCPFLSFQLSVQDHQSPIWLMVSGPEGAKVFIEKELEL